MTRSPRTAPPVPSDPAAWGRVHLVGIGGAGMSAVAALLAARGPAVSGSDRRASPLLADLAAAGVTVHVGHAAEHVAAADVVVVSSAIPPDNPEVAAAAARGVPVVHRSRALAALMTGRRAVAVAGAHGKSTTAAMLATVLREAGMDPDFAIGATVPPPAGAGPGWAVGGGHTGDGDVFVAEADESDGSFLAYRPLVAVVTNVEPDHLDHYGDEAAFVAAFEDFAARVTGHLVVCADDAGSARLGERTAAGGGPRVVSYGTAATADVTLHWTPEDRGGLVRVSGALGEAELTVPAPGEHNARNAVGAWTAAVLLGVDPHRAAAGMAAFAGTGRRFEHRGTVHGVRVVDDYAHHPTEVGALLAAARPVAGRGRVLVLFQPHLFSRTAAFAREFAEALTAADDVVVTDVYAAREDPLPGVSGALITDALPGARFVADLREAARVVATLARPGDLVLTVGAGDVTEAADDILAAIAGPAAGSEARP